MCTIFATGNQKNMLIAKNYDSFIDGGMIFTNRRNMKKNSLVMPSEKKFEWVSEYGSITFSQSGKGMPSSGINEKGFIVEQATYPGTVYPPKDNRAEISCLEVTQYLLDTCENIEQAISAFERFRINQNSGKVHFFLWDKSYGSAIVEFTEGQMEIYQDSDMIYPILTNSAYGLLCQDTSFEFSNEYDKNSAWRFNSVKEFLVQNNSVRREQAFQLLRQTERKDTVWSIIYDLEDSRLYFRTNCNQQIRCLDLKTVDFSETADSYLYDLDSRGGQFAFERYSRALNRKNIENFYGNEILLEMMGLPDAKFVIDSFDEHIQKIEERS